MDTYKLIERLETLNTESAARIAELEAERMTVGNLRKALFNIDDQNMTVKELRAVLFAIDNQGALISEDLLKGKS